MIIKEDIFAQGSENRDNINATTFREGLIPNTVARAEEVNMCGFMSDRDLWVVCKELVGLLTLYGVLPNNSYDNGQQAQLVNTFVNNVKREPVLTGVYQPTSPATSPTQNGNTITFPALQITYNSGVYYGDKLANQKTVPLSSSSLTLSATSAWSDGVHFIYAKLPTPSSAECVLDHQDSPIDGRDGGSKCMLGSVYVINGQFQSGSWKYQPWLTITSADTRQSPTAYTKGGFVSAASATTLQMGSLEIRDEGINYDTDQLLPNITTVAAKNPFTYKFLYPDYNPASADLSTLDTTHVYNMTAGTWDDVSSYVSADHPKYMVVVPCIVPTGQTLMIPAMSTKTGDYYNQLFDTQEAAINAVYALPYQLGNTAKRVIYLGQSLVVKVGATDLTDPLQMISVGMLPQALSSFTTASGQAGGGITTYRPMPAITWEGFVNVSCQNNTLNRIIGASSNITVSLPSPQNNILNELEIHFIKNDTGTIVWGTNITWYGGVTPTFSDNKAYNIVLENMAGTWYGGVLSA